MSRLTLGAVVLLLAVGVAPVCAQDDEWLENLNAAKAQARGEGRPLLILFVLEGCPECARMERSLGAPGAKRALEPFVKVRLEFYEHRDLALRYGIEYTPTLLVYLPSDGFSSCRERHVGALSPASLQRLSQRILSQCAKAAQSQANAEIVKTPATTNPPSVTPTLSWQVSQRYLSEKPTRKDRSVGLGLADVYHNVVNH
ncbi:MAG: thioredoxin family protein [Candidatus Sumerlaeaceae bacterium]|nr:thioredoxin family protein [Candidatus Sumerlaeaceae bacterium]